MRNWNIPDNAFTEIQTTFLNKHSVIFSLLPYFNEFHHKLHISKISGTILEKLRGSTSTKNFFLCFNGVILIFGQLFEHGDTVMKIYFLKLLLPVLPNLIAPNGEKCAHL